MESTHVFSLLFPRQVQFSSRVESQHFVAVRSNETAQGNECKNGDKEVAFWFLIVVVIRTRFRRPEFGKLILLRLVAEC